jgi:hypothetical protein
VVDVDTLRERVLAKGRQLGFGAPAGDVVPLYGPHGNPGPHRDLELLNVETGEIRVAVRAKEVEAKYRDWLSTSFGERPVSIFFPVMSPDGDRAFFKLASPRPTTVDPRSPEFFRRSASDRKGLLCVDLKTGALAFPAPHAWGHPAWHPDGRRILEINHRLIDAESGATRTIPNLPKLKGGPHPSVRKRRASGRCSWATSGASATGSSRRWTAARARARGAAVIRIRCSAPTDAGSTSTPAPARGAG